jgi:hypothetical protein
MQSVPITTDVVSSNLGQGEMYNIMWSFDYNCNGAISEVRIHTMVIRFPSEHVLLAYLVMAPGFSC